MVAGTTSASIVNRALAEIAGQYSVTGTNPTFDGSAAGNAAGTLYNGAVNLLLRQSDYEFSRTTVALTPLVVATPLNWTYAFLYPTDCLKIRQVFPTIATPDYDPQPILWDVATVAISGFQNRAIYTNIAPASLVYTTSSVTENEWDSMFEEAMVRYLASELAMAIGGRPDFSKEMLGVAGGLSQESGGKDS
jgi:hypothetical protein